MAQYPTSAAGDSELYVAVNNTSTTLTDNPLSAGATTVNVNDASSFPSVGAVTIDAEIIKYTGKTGTSFTGCTRGFDGTSDVSHLVNTPVYHRIIANHHNVVKDEIKAIETDLIAIKSALNDADTPASTATDVKDRLDQVVSQLKAITGTANWYSAVAKSLNQLLPLSGGTMSGDVAMGTNDITDVGIELIGTTAQRTDIVGAGNNLQMEGINYATSAMSIIRNTNDSGGGGFVLGKSRGTTIGSNTIVQDGDILGTIYFAGSDGTKIINGARIQCRVDGTPGVDDMPGYLAFLTTPNGSATAVERLRINSVGQSLFSNGTVGSPSISFGSDTDTGIFSSVANQVLFSCGGVLKAVLSATDLDVKGSIVVADGTVSLPSITFNSDTNTGMYRYGANTIGFSCDGAYRFVVSDSSVVSTVPFYASAGSASLPGISFQGDADTGIYLSAANTIAFSTGGTLRALLTASEFSIQADGCQIEARNGTISAPGYSFQSNTDTGIWLNSSDIDFSVNGSLAFSVQPSWIYIYRDTVPSGTGTYSLGTSTNYWNDISYKTLTDRGCLPWCDEGVELPDGTIVSDLEAISRISKHPTKLTIQGLPMLDYKTFPKKAYKKAEVNGVLLERDSNDEPIGGADGVEMTMMFGVMFGAIKELTQKLVTIEERLVILETPQE